MTSVYDVEPNELIEKASEELKKVDEVKPPEWAPFVKTGVHKERAPLENDWWYVRCAAILRTVYKLGPIGVSKLRTKYGGKKNRGMKTEHFYKGSGNIARKVLQQLEKAGFVKKGEKGVHKGRVITGKGASFLDKVATKIAKSGRVEKKEEKIQIKKEEKKEAVRKDSPVEVKEKKEAKKKEAAKEEKQEKKEAKKEAKQEKKKEEAKKEEKKEQKQEKPKAEAKKETK